VPQPVAEHEPELDHAVYVQVASGGGVGNGVGRGVGAGPHVPQFEHDTHAGRRDSHEPGIGEHGFMQ